MRIARKVVSDCLRGIRCRPIGSRQRIGRAFSPMAVPHNHLRAARRAAVVASLRCAVCGQPCVNAKSSRALYCWPAHGLRAFRARQSGAPRPRIRPRLAGRFSAPGIYHNSNCLPSRGRLAAELGLADGGRARRHRSRRTHDPAPAIEKSRAPGWRLPPKARSVARPHQFSNPFRVVGPPHRVIFDRTGQEFGQFSDKPAALQRCVELHYRWILAPEQAARRAMVRKQLRGLALACFCPEGAPCHADVLIPDRQCGAVGLLALVCRRAHGGLWRRSRLPVTASAATILPVASTAPMVAWVFGDVRAASRAPRRRSCHLRARAPPHRPLEQQLRHGDSEQQAVPALVHDVHAEPAVPPAALGDTLQHLAAGLDVGQQLGQGSPSAAIAIRQA